MEPVIKRLKVADISPLKDEYGNEYAQRDYTLQVNKDYVARLAESFGPSGEPDEMIKVIEEGGVCYVKAGRSRLEAMRLLGTEECYAVIDPDTSLKAALETVVRTNAKKTYEDVELSGFVQQLAMFGDDDYVGEVASIGSDKARRLRKAREIVGERAEQMTLDRLYAIPDFEGDEDAVNALVNASEVNWAGVAQKLRREKAEREKLAAFKAMAAELGMTLVDKRPEDKRYALRCEEPEELAASYAEASEKYTGIVGMVDNGWSGYYVSFFADPVQGEEDAAEAERRRLADEYGAMAKGIDDALASWVVKVLSDETEPKDLTSLESLCAFCARKAKSNWIVSGAVKALPCCFEDKADPALFAIGYSLGQVRLAQSSNALAGYGVFTGWHARQLADAVKWVDLHIADGWEPDEAQAEFLDMAREKLQSAASEADDEDEEDE